jgi:hypothetical protein
MKTNSGLALYRRLEFPNESAVSWPIARPERVDVVARLVTRARELRAKSDRGEAAA